jgi:cytochrome c oxidase subunit 2
MGFTDRSNLWHWKADRDAEVWRGVKPGRKAYADHHYPFEKTEVLPITTPKLKSPVQDLLAERAGSITRKTLEQVQGRGVWKDGRWTVMFTRSLVTDNTDQDAQIGSGIRRFGFAVWDGDQGDRGGRKSISDWVELDILPAGEPATGERPRLINVMAKRFQFTPSQIEVKKDELITIRLQSEDLPHGMYIDGYDKNIKTGPGLVVKTTFRATKTGRFSFRCSETCGEFHPYMIGFLTVTPNTRFHLFASMVAATALLVAIGVIRTACKQKGTAPNE